jgi:hypothetical protein
MIRQTAPASLAQRFPQMPRVLALLLALLFFAAPPRVAAQDATASDTGGVTIAGTVYDSLAGKPLVGALVQVVARGEKPRAWNATSDANGAFEIAGVPHGLFLVGFMHPALDSLGLGVSPHTLDVTSDAPVRVALAVPSAPTIRRLLCAESGHADSTGLMLGFIRDADTGAPLADARAVVIWTELVVDKGIHTDRREVPVKANGEGWYALCGVPADGPITARAELGKDASGYIEVNVPPNGVLHRDFNIPRGAAAVAVSDSGASDVAEAGIQLRHGSARLSGVVRNAQGQPLGGAQVMVWGSDVTGSARDDGTFTLSDLPAGTQALEARYVGYAPKRMAVDLASNETRSVTVTLDQRADVLDQVTVYGKASRRRSDITGFLDRRKSGIGHFITRADIAKMRPFEFTDIMRRVPGIKLVPTSYFDYTILSSRGATVNAKGCQPAIYIDGARLIDDTAINGMLLPGDVAGIEVYAGPSEAPPQYSNGDCGSILIWTGPDPGGT